MKIAERMARVETKLESIEEKLDKFIESADKKHDRFVDSADKKYAPRWIMYILSFGATILSIIVAAGIIKYLFGG